MKIKDLNRKPKHITSIGGQALIEGLLMRGPKELAIAVRKPDGEIVLKEEELNTLGMRKSFFRLPFIRGVVGLVESMVIGVNALLYSSEFYEDEEDEENENEKVPFLERIFGDKAENVSIGLTLLTSLTIAIVLFMLLPNFLTTLLKKNITSPIILNLIEGAIRIVIFAFYLIMISKMEDVGRVFEYHGAEHKTIHCYENGDELTVENVKKYSILHPRCGTSFLFMVMIVSILVLSFFGWPSPLMRILTRILMLPVIAGISYEINRLIGKSSGKLAYILSYPGLMIQKFATVKEPDGEQIEVAIVALEAVLTGNKEEDKWS